MAPIYLNFSNAPDGEPPAAKPLLDEVASLDRDINPRSYNGILSQEDDTLANRGGGKGLKIYDELERDGRAFSVLQKRKMAVIARDWVVEPASESALDVQAADLVREQLAAAGFDQLTLGLLDAIPKGFAVAEVMWALEGGAFVFKRAIPRDQRRFVFDIDGQLRMLVPESMVKGVELPARKFIHHSQGAKDENPYGLGLGTRLFWYCWFKRQVLANWLVFTDKFASPTAIGEYPPGTPKVEQDRLLRAASSLAQETAIAIPQGMVLRLLEAGRTGGAEAYERFLTYCDQMIAEVVLGESLTTSAGASGSRALGEVHNDVRLELVKADADLLSSTLAATVVQWITELNVPGAEPPTVYRSFEEPEDLTAAADRDTKIMKLGYRPTPEYIRRVYGDGWVPAKAPAGNQVGDPNTLMPGEAAFNEMDPADQLLALAEAGGPAAMAGLLAPLRELVDSATSLEAVRNGLTDLYPKLDGTAFSELMQLALTTAVLSGRFEVLDGR